MIERILPPGVVVSEVFGDPPGHVLFPEEEAIIADAPSTERRREFRTGRRCAHRALAELGYPPGPVLKGPDKAPVWPDEVTGTITHDTGYRCAAVARVADILSIGIDANAGSRRITSYDSMTVPAERRRLAELAAERPDVPWGRILFSAKEAAFKAWYPPARTKVGMRQAEVLIDPDRGTFRAHVLTGPGPEVNGRPLTGVSGEWMVKGDLVLTAASVINSARYRPGARAQSMSAAVVAGRGWSPARATSGHVRPAPAPRMPTSPAPHTRHPAVASAAVPRTDVQRGVQM
ncbi:4'-phosphopantetheinyl transferase superfamily protein [Embleya sp. NBC_00896]|uniref:4'-phosphopantetheinyl transferase family protein n=1 Tax=Embleya sp. NBC_00896 TaxID=2975961 RepID=UPI002F91A53E|nr:4'-phosphopantetheinyl transferase superfamily protein [Embleya sp. NBC_00896]